ncbi:MAG: TrkH family potassium uptake protein [Tissierellia bacterium]|nr:TrkH family potassium uptake protein [Tissierellia bacterium]
MIKTNITERLQKNPPLFLTMGFLAMIVGGSLLLMLPMSSSENSFTPLLDSVFTATSSVCVTGLTTVDTATHWSTFGHIVIITLIQIGGLGFMTATSILALILGKRFTLSDRLIISEQMGMDNIKGMVKLIRYVIFSAFFIEGTGAILLMFSLVPQYGAKGIWYSVFHAISAFCNAGFDLFGNSLLDYTFNPYIIGIISLLIIIGGLGFGVYMDISSKKTKFQMYSLHTKIVLVTTFLLIISMTIITFVLESNNPSTLQNVGFFDRLTASFFQSVTLRTSGFQSMPQEQILDSTAAMSIPYMFIGGSPGATAGGIKTTTFALLFIVLFNEIKGSEDIVCFHRRIRFFVVRRAISIFILALLWVSISTIILLIVEPYPFIDILFEIVSAFGTVGLTRALTPHLQNLSKIIIILSMYLGRVGTMTVIFAFSEKNVKKGFKEAHGEVIIG